MMKRCLLLTWILAALINQYIFCQPKIDYNKIFIDAESWFLFEDFKEALPLYQQLLKAFPDNANIKFRIGQCSLRIPGEKAKAIGYLEDAVKNINPKYVEGKFRETGAPIDAIYYLSTAYRINNQVDNALKTMDRFSKDLDTRIFDTAVVNLQIRSCLTAKDLMNRPLSIKLTNLGNNINGERSEFNPVISSNEDLLIFSRSEAFYDAIMFSVKVNGQWSNPQNMNEMLQVDKDIYPTSVSKDNKELYLYSSIDMDGTILMSRFEKGRWLPPVRLNNNINTKFWESHASISHDNKKLFFTSNRKGGYGGLDIYVSRRDSTKDWGPAINLGPVINSQYNEESPFLTEDDKTLFFSSRGHYNMGGLDIFYSSLLENGEWSVPMNAGYPLNTTDDDIFFDPVKDGYIGYISVDSHDSFGKQDIYRVEIFDKDHPRKFLVKGAIRSTDRVNIPYDSVRIVAINTSNPKQTVIIHPNTKTGEFEFLLPEGKYQITYENEGVQKIIKSLDLAATTPSENLLLPEAIIAKTDFVADLHVLTDQINQSGAGDTILIPLKVEPKSLLTIEHWLGDSLEYKEELHVTDSLFNYKMVPGIGDNKVVFKLKDGASNVTTTEVHIDRQKEIAAGSQITAESSSIIDSRQIASLLTIMNARADEKLKKFIASSGIDKQQFSSIDDIFTFLKKEAQKAGISDDEIGKLALKIAVMDNILTQTAVDLMARYSSGELKKILSELDIQQSDIKTWQDLLDYVQSKSGGRISPDELNRLADEILRGMDPGIALLRDKILEYARKSKIGTILLQSVDSADIRKTKTAGEWLNSVYDEAIKLKVTNNQMAEMLAKLSSGLNTPASQYVKDLAYQSDESLRSSLASVNLEKEKIRTPSDLLSFLLQNKDKVGYQPKDLFKSIARLIIARNQPVDYFGSRMIARADENLKNFIVSSGFNKHRFGNNDDLISFLKKGAPKAGIGDDEIDKLALKVAVMDNILTQAAVDLMARYSTGELKKILSDLDIYKSDIKTWQDLLEYVNSESKGRISPDELNRLADEILRGIDPGIALLRDKILEYSRKSKIGNLLKQSVDSADIRKTKTAGEWLKSVYDEATILKITNDQMAEMLAKLSARLKTSASQYLKDLAYYSDENLRSSVASIDMEKEKIKTPSDLLSFLLQNKDKVRYLPEDLFNSIARLIISRNQPVYYFGSRMIARADEKLKNFIISSGFNKHRFGNNDDLISFLKKGAPKAGIGDEEIGKLALKVAVMDNILTQAAVNLMARNSSGELKKILSDLDIYKSDLKTWYDLIEYVQSESEGRIGADELNRLADEILRGQDPGILLLRDRILEYARKSEIGALIKQSVDSADIRKTKTAGEWLKSVYDEANKQKITNDQLTEMMARLSSGSKTKASQYLKDLASQADEILRSSLASVDLKKEKIKTPSDLLNFLIENNDRIKFPLDDIFSTIAKLIISRNQPEEGLFKRLLGGAGIGTWILIVLIGSGLISLFVILLKKKKKEKENRPGN
jgi:hypothetical protein